MKCHICDREISDKEIQYIKEAQEFEPCSTCLEIAMDAAYSDGFLKDDDKYILVEDCDLPEYDSYLQEVTPTKKVWYE